MSEKTYVSGFPPVSSGGFHDMKMLHFCTSSTSIGPFGLPGGPIMQQRLICIDCYINNY